jgi:hypothetical protein
MQLDMILLDKIGTLVVEEYDGAGNNVVNPPEDELR